MVRFLVWLRPWLVTTELVSWLRHTRFSVPESEKKLKAISSHYSRVTCALVKRKRDCCCSWILKVPVNDIPQKHKLTLRSGVWQMVSVLIYRTVSRYEEVWVTPISKKKKRKKNLCYSKSHLRPPSSADRQFRSTKGQMRLQDILETNKK